MNDNLMGEANNLFGGYIDRIVEYEVNKRTEELRDALETLCDSVETVDYGEKGRYTYCPLCGEPPYNHAQWCPVTEARKVLEK